MVFRNFFLDKRKLLFQFIPRMFSMSLYGPLCFEKNSSIFGGDDEYAINCYSNLVFTYVSFVELKLLAMHTQQLMYLSTLHPSEG